jgi:hypothetical protein
VSSLKLQSLLLDSKDFPSEDSNTLAAAGAELKNSEKDIGTHLINMMNYLLCTLRVKKILARDMLQSTEAGSHLLLPRNIDSINLVMRNAI